MMFKKILLCFDGSNSAKHAAKVALSLAASYKAYMEILSVIATPQFGVGASNAGNEYERGRSYFLAGQAEIVQQATKLGIPVGSRIVCGNVARSIVRCAQEAGIDLIVLGHCGHNNVSEIDHAHAGGDAELGSIADRVSERAPCSVLVAR